MEGKNKGKYASFFPYFFLNLSFFLFLLSFSLSLPTDGKKCQKICLFYHISLWLSFFPSVSSCFLHHLLFISLSLPSIHLSVSSFLLFLSIPIFSLPSCIPFLIHFPFFPSDHVFLLFSFHFSSSIPFSFLLTFLIYPSYFFPFSLPFFYSFHFPSFLSLILKLSVHA